MKATIVRSALTAAVVLLSASSALSAQEPVYSADELTERPQLRSPSKTAELIRAAYTADLRDSGISGTVQLAFVIDEAGRVDAGSVKILASTADALSDAAKKVAPKLEFKPGKKDTKAVRTQVVLPLVFRQ